MVLNDLIETSFCYSQKNAGLKRLSECNHSLIRLRRNKVETLTIATATGLLSPNSTKRTRNRPDWRQSLIHLSRDVAWPINPTSLNKMANVTMSGEKETVVAHLTYGTWPINNDVFIKWGRNKNDKKTRWSGLVVPFLNGLCLRLGL